MKTACVVNRPSPKDTSEASRFHGVTDGPLFRAAAKKKTPMPWSTAYSQHSAFHYDVALRRHTPPSGPLRKQVVFFFEISPFENRHDLLRG